MNSRKAPSFRAQAWLGASSTITLILHLAAPSASAQSTRWWDGGTVDIGTNGDGVATNASGTWSTSIANWDQGSGLAHVVWTNGNNIANFAGGTNTITLGSAITVGRINQTGGGSGITINGGGNMLTLGSATTVFNVAASTTVGRAMTMNAVVTGSNALTAVGPSGASGNGSVNLNAINTFTGNLTASQRVTLSIGSGGSAGQLNSGNYSGAISIANTASNFVYGSSLNQILGGNITGLGILTKSSSTVSNLILTGANSYSGGTNINAGTLTFRNTGARSATGTVTVAAGATLGLGVATSGSFFTSANVDSLFAGSLSGVTNDATSNVGVDTTQGNFTYATSVGGAPTRGLAKLGANTLTLTGNSTYTGATTVSAGVLAVNGSLANTATTVENGATLQGSGAIGGSVTIQTGGTLAAGNSIESLGTGALSFATGSTFAYELQTNLYGSSPNESADLTHSTGTLDIAAGGILTLTDLATSTALALGSKLTLISYAGGWTGTELFTYNAATLSDGGIFTLGTNEWLFNYDDTTGGPNYTSDQSGATRFVTITVVPEPGAALLGGLGLLALLRRRR